MIYFQVKVADEIKAIYDTIQPALETAKFHLEDAKRVIIEPVEMTADEYVDLTDKLI